MDSLTKRLNKYISEKGICSRREADKLIEEGQVTINGAIAVVGTKVQPGDDVCIDGKSINQTSEKLVYLAFN